jgi:hypothetical protein
MTDGVLAGRAWHRSLQGAEFRGFSYGVGWTTSEVAGVGALMAFIVPCYGGRGRIQLRPRDSNLMPRLVRWSSASVSPTTCSTALRVPALGSLHFP